MKHKYESKSKPIFKTSQIYKKSNPIIANNSSMLTAENSSTLPSKKTKKKLNFHKNPMVIDEKYLNINLFELSNNSSSLLNSKSKHFKSPSNNNTIGSNFQLYLTETRQMTNYNINKKNNSNISINTNTYSNKTLANILENNNLTYKQKLKKTHNNFSHDKNKNILPNIKRSTFSFHYRDNEKIPSIFSCCDQHLRPKILTKLYYDQQRMLNQNENDKNNKNNKININNKIKIKRTVRDSSMDYIKKTNEIKKYLFTLSLKNDAIKDYQENMKTQMQSLDRTLTTINSYKNNLENQFLVKYNEQLRDLDKHIVYNKKIIDSQNETLGNLQKETSTLSQLIVKKTAYKKYIEKWLAFQILIKEGKEPLNIEEYIKNKYKNKVIFENIDELTLAFKEKEDKNIRLLINYEKGNKEKDILAKHLKDVIIESEGNDYNIDLIIIDREKVLKNLKHRNMELSNTIKTLEKNKSNDNFKFINNNNIKKKEIKMEQNALGVLYKPFNVNRNLFNMINCIYLMITQNNCVELKSVKNINYEILNLNMTKSKRAISQMRVIELSLNYLYSFIREILLKDKNSKQIIKATLNKIDLYKKKVNSDKHKADEIKRLNEFMKIIEGKNNKIYYLQNKKIDHFPFGYYRERKNKNIKRSNSNKDEFWDFIDTISESDNNNNIKKNQSSASINSV